MRLVVKVGGAQIEEATGREDLAQAVAAARAAGPEVIPAAYNAGQGAVDRWLREHGDVPLDQFVESIPYAETRGYTRRVLQSWGVYAYLETGRVEPLGSTLPRL